MKHLVSIVFAGILLAGCNTAKPAGNTESTPKPFGELTPEQELDQTFQDIVYEKFEFIVHKNNKIKVAGYAMEISVPELMTIPTGVIKYTGEITLQNNNRNGIKSTQDFTMEADFDYYTGLMVFKKPDTEYQFAEFVFQDCYGSGCDSPKSTARVQNNSWHGSFADIYINPVNGRFTNDPSKEKLLYWKDVENVNFETLSLHLYGQIHDSGVAGVLYTDGSEVQKQSFIGNFTGSRCTECKGIIPTE